MPKYVIKPQSLIINGYEFLYSVDLSQHAFSLHILTTIAVSIVISIITGDKMRNSNSNSILSGVAAVTDKLLQLRDYLIQIGTFVLGQLNALNIQLVFGFYCFVKTFESIEG